MPSDDSKELRRELLQTWAFENATGLGFVELEPLVSASDDASFRRYFRLHHGSGSLICVDAPPDKEDNPAFVHVLSLLEDGGVSVPHLFASDLSQGFLMISDLGNDLFLDQIDGEPLSGQIDLYKKALNMLGQIVLVDGRNLPVYNEAKLREEMMLFPDWFLSKQLRIGLYPDFEGIMSLMEQNSYEQPKVLVHRDYHGRNLMLVGDELATIDFQDAVYGAITYDLVSLLKDCYWRLPRDTVKELVECYRLQLCLDVSKDVFLRWFDLMGFQRHLKCAGIFSRLNLRDGKSRYLADIPLVIDYLVEVADLYPELHAFGGWLKTEVQPRLGELSSDLVAESS